MIHNFSNATTSANWNFDENRPPEIESEVNPLKRNPPSDFFTPEKKLYKIKGDTDGKSSGTKPPIPNTEGRVNSFIQQFPLFMQAPLNEFSLEESELDLTQHFNDNMILSDTEDDEGMPNFSTSSQTGTTSHTYQLEIIEMIRSYNALLMKAYHGSNEEEITCIIASLDQYILELKVTLNDDELERILEEFLPALHFDEVHLDPFSF